MLTTLIIVLIAFFVYKKFAVPKELKHIPAIPIWSTLKAIYNNSPLDIVNNEEHQDLMNKYGMARMWIFGKWIVIVSDEEAVKKVFYETDNYPKYIEAEHYPDTAFAKFIGKNLLFSNGKEWKAQRRVINPIFKKSFNPDLFATTVNRFIEVIEKNQGENIEVNKYMQRLSLEILGRCIFDVDFNSIHNPKTEFIQRYNTIMMNHFSIINMLFPGFDREYNPLMKQSHINADWFKKEFKGILNEKKEALKNNTKEDCDLDLLSCMVKAGQNEGSDFSEDIIIDNCIIFFLAGHDTTATSLSAALHFLAKNFDIQEKCRKEVKSIIKGNVGTTEELKKLDYLTCVIKESMRMYPPVARSTDRITKTELKVKYSYVPKDAIFVTNTLAMNMNSKIFKNPKEFQPKRFQNNANYGVNYSPFLNGTRQCIGVNFSMDEQRVVLSMLLSRYFIYYENSKINPTLPVGFSGLLQVGDVKLNFKPL